MAPAMNVRMWLHPATVQNLETLTARGVLTVGPDEGEMACGEYGPGRMAEPQAIFEAIEAALGGPAARPLAGRRALVTAGPTVEPIDPVRVLTNRSSRQAGLCGGRGAGAAGRRGDPGLRPHRAGRAARRDARRRRDGRGDAGGLRRPRCRPTSPCWSPRSPTGGPREPPGPRSRRARARPTLSLSENPDILATLSQGRAASGRGSWSASPPRPTTWRPTPGPSWTPRAAT